MLPVLSNYRAGSAPPESPLPSLPALPQSSPYPPGHHHTQCEWAGLDFHSNHQSGESCCIPLRELPEAPGTLYLKAVFLPAYMIQRCFIHSEVCLYAGNFWALIWSGVQSEGHEVCQNKGRKGTKTRKELWKRKKKNPRSKAPSNLSVNQQRLLRDISQESTFKRMEHESSVMSGSPWATWILQHHLIRTLEGIHD